MSLVLLQSKNERGGKTVQYIKKIALYRYNGKIVLTVNDTQRGYLHTSDASSSSPLLSPLFFFALSLIFSSKFQIHSNRSFVGNEELHLRISFVADIREWRNVCGCIWKYVDESVLSLEGASIRHPKITISIQNRTRRLHALLIPLVWPKGARGLENRVFNVRESNKGQICTRKTAFYYYSNGAAFHSSLPAL